MDVDVQVLVEVLGEAEQLPARTDVGHRRLRRLLHHLAELPGHGQLPLSRQRHHLDVQELPTHLGPGKSGDEPDGVLKPGLAVLEPGCAKVAGYLARLHGAAQFSPFGHGEGDLAADGADLALQVPHPRLAGVAAHQLKDRRVGEADPLPG